MRYRCGRWRLHRKIHYLNWVDWASSHMTCVNGSNMMEENGFNDFIDVMWCNISAGSLIEPLTLIYTVRWWHVWPRCLKRSFIICCTCVTIDYFWNNNIYSWCYESWCFCYSCICDVPERGSEIIVRSFKISRIHTTLDSVNCIHFILLHYSLLR